MNATEIDKAFVYRFRAPGCSAGEPVSIPGLDETGNKKSCALPAPSFRGAGQNRIRLPQERKRVPNARIPRLREIPRQVVYINSIPFSDQLLMDLSGARYGIEKSPIIKPG